MAAVPIAPGTMTSHAAAEPYCNHVTTAWVEVPRAQSTTISTSRARGPDQPAHLLRHRPVSIRPAYGCNSARVTARKSSNRTASADFRRGSAWPVGRCGRWGGFGRVTPMITAENLTKRYHHHIAVDDVSFTCEPGTVTGFLGPNGAGKSTTLRMLTGLTPPTAGRVAIDGRSYPELPNPGRLVGVMLDAAAQHPGRTGLETLRITARLLDLPKGRAAEMLERVGLGDVGKRRVGDYSLGMRQRLGIGSALIGDPAILVLDEPANGMDPEGIRWMRELLRD